MSILKKIFGGAEKKTTNESVKKELPNLNRAGRRAEVKRDAKKAKQLDLLIHRQNLKRGRKLTKRLKKEAKQRTKQKYAKI